MSCTARGGAMDYQIGVSISDHSLLASGDDPVIDDLPDRRSGGLKPVGKPRNRGASSPIQLPGGEAVLALAGGIADQISTMARQIHDRLSAEESASRIDLDTPVPPDRRSFEVDTVTVEFGLTASAKSGVGLAVLADIGGSSSINVTMTIKRVRPTEPVGAGGPGSEATP